MPDDQTNDTDQMSDQKKDGAAATPADKIKKATEDARSNPGNEGMRSARTEDDDRTLEELAEGD